MKFVLSLGLMSGALLLSGCSWLYGEGALVHDSSNDFLKSKQGQALELPDGYSNKKINDELVIPNVPEQPSGVPLGDEAIEKPPIQILSVSEGIRTHRHSQNPGVLSVKSVDEVKQQVADFFKQNDIAFSESSTGFTTDWVVENNEAWWRSLFGSDLPKFARSKYEVSILPETGGKETAVTVKQLEYEIMTFDEDEWLKRSASKEASIGFLNQFVGYVDYLERLENARRLQQLSRGITVKLGRDINNNAALVAESDWQAVWLKSPEILTPFGFTLNDKDQSKGTYFFEFEANEPGFFASMFGDDEAVALDLPNGPYQAVIGGQQTAPVTITFIDSDGNPLSDGKMAQLFPYLSEAYGRNVKKKKGKKRR